MTKKTRAFTIEYSGIVNMLKTEIRVSESFNPEEEGNVIYPPIFEYKSIWDTGATNSVISSNVVNRLGLTPIGKIKVFHVDGASFMYTYLINIFLPNNVIFASLIVTESKLPSGTDILIGMDIISTGDFTITSSKGKTKFSFQFPSTHDIDYEKE